MAINRQLFIALGAAATLSLGGCQSEEPKAGFEHGGIPASVTLTVPTDGTRTELTENHGNLDWEWSAGDRLLVTTKSGDYAGVMTVDQINPENPASASFKGSLSESLGTSGKVDLNFYFPGHGVDPLSIEKSHTVKLASQGGTFDELKTRDVLSTEITVNMNPNYVAIPDFFIKHHLSAGHFELKFADESTELETVTVSGTGLYNATTINLGNRSMTSAPGTISVNPAARDFYLTLVPSDNLQLTFTATTKEGKSYQGSLNGFKLNTAVYLRRKLSDTEYVGIPVEMKESSVLPDPYPNEDKRNPLHKFAKYNLMRDGAAGTIDNTFTTSETDNGALYQWGRNYGYMDKSGTYPGSSLSIRGDFTNYFDALGDFTWHDAFDNPSTNSSNWYYRLFDFYVYNPLHKAVTTGTGLTGFSRYNSSIGGTEFWANLDAPNGFETIDELTEARTNYIFNLGDNNGDYWPTAFGDGGSTWTDRAENCGYDNGNPCPEGWRLPTYADFLEITPSSMPSYNGSLSTLITQEAQAELRETNSGVRYVIRWLNFSAYLEIQAIVVDNDFKESDIAALTWDNNPLLVSRKFPYTGNISVYKNGNNPAYDTRLTNYLGQEIFFIAPMHRGAITQTKKEAGSLYYGVYWYPWTLFTPAENYNSSIGGYWMEDRQMVFQFLDMAKSKIDTFSALRLHSQEAEVGYAIRPVMDR